MPPPRILTPFRVGGAAPGAVLRSRAPAARQRPATRTSCTHGAARPVSTTRERRRSIDAPRCVRSAESLTARAAERRVPLLTEDVRLGAGCGPTEPDTLAHSHFSERTTHVKLSDLSPAEHRRIEVAVHEAGHAVQVILAGGQIAEVKLNDDDPDTPGECWHTDVPKGREREVSYAGPWAESRWRHGESPRLQHVLALLASNASDCDDVVRSDRGLPREIENQLETCWSSITKLAGALFVDGRLDDRTVRAALGMDGDERHDRMVRAAIRCGDAPGSFTVHLPYD